MMEGSIIYRTCCERIRIYCVCISIVSIDYDSNSPWFWRNCISLFYFTLSLSFFVGVCGDVFFHVLKGNQFSSESAQSLSDMLRENTTLLYLSLSCMFQFNISSETWLSIFLTLVVLDIFCLFLGFFVFYVHYSRLDRTGRCSIILWGSSREYFAFVSWSWR